MRFSLELAAGVASVVAFGLDDLRLGDLRLGRHTRVSQRKLASAGSLVVAATVVVATQLPQWPRQGGYRAQPASVLPLAIDHAIPAGDPVAITYPYAVTPSIQGMLWQAEAGFTFRILGGYAYRAGVQGAPKVVPALLDPPGLDQFLGRSEQAAGYGPPEPLTPQIVAAARTDLDVYDIRIAIVDQGAAGSAQPTALFDRVFGPPKTTADGFSIWRSPSGGVL